MNPSRPPTPPPASREFAFRILSEAADSGRFPTQLLEDREGDLADRDRAFARFLVQAVVRRKLTLETVLQHFVQRSVEPGLWILLKIGAAQLLLSGRADAHAAVNETVETARRAGNPRWCGFLNGVLRNLARERQGDIEERRIDAHCYPTAAAGFYGTLARPLFPDPQTDLPGYLSAAFSMPRWLVDRWSQRFDRDTLVGMLEWFTVPTPLGLRVNALRADRGDLLRQLAERQLEAVPGEPPCAIRIVQPNVSVAALPGFAEGMLTVQDETAQHAALLLNPQPGETVLDLCAAPGTKTAHLAEVMQNEGTVVATDVGSDRLDRITENATRLGLDSIRTQLIARDGSDIPAGPFDAILLDAPCTNTGVLGKRVEARWRISEADIRELSELQQRLLQQAADRVRPGGRLLYSTCSIEPEENRENVDRFLSARRDFTLDQDQEFLPGHPADGGYQALLRRADA